VADIQSATAEIRRGKKRRQKYNGVPYYLEVATPTPRPFQAAAAMLLPGEVTATALLATYL